MHGTGGPWLLPVLGPGCSCVEEHSWCCRCDWGTLASFFFSLQSRVWFSRSGAASKILLFQYTLVCCCWCWFMDHPLSGLIRTKMLTQLFLHFLGFDLSSHCRKWNFIYPLPLFPSPTYTDLILILPIQRYTFFGLILVFILLYLYRQ